MGVQQAAGRVAGQIWSDAIMPAAPDGALWRPIGAPGCLGSMPATETTP